MNNLIYKEIYLKGFRTYKNETTFKLDREPGLYFFTGNNLIDEVGANDVGKSTLWDALVWCQWGKTLRGVKGSHVINWNSKTAKVSIPFSKNGVEHLITRTQKPNSIILDEQEVSQEKVDDLLGTYEQFQYNAVIGQFNTTFLDLDPSPKLALFSNIMNLSLWERASKKASDLEKTTESKIIEVSADLANLKNNKKKLEIQLEDLEKQYNSFEDEKKQTIQNYRSEISTKLNTISETEKQLVELGKLLEFHTTQRDNHNKKAAILIASEKEFTDNITKLKSDLRVVNSQLDSKTKELNKWKELKDICPYCDQNIDQTFAQVTRTGLTKFIVEYKKSINSINSDIEHNKEQLETITDSMEESVKALETINDQIKTVQREQTKLTSTLTVTRASIQNLRSNIEKEEERENPFAKLIEQSTKQSAQLDQDIEDTTAKLTEVGKINAGYSYWSKGFKELRLWIVSDALHSFEFETNEALNKLGLEGWNLHYQMEKENVSGGISKGFNVLVNSNESANLTNIPFEAWGGGNTQRMRLAAAFGLSSLIQGYSGLSANIHILDEPTHHLSGIGVEDLITYLSEYALTNNKAVYFIDHSNLTSPAFKQIFTVIKDKNGSRIE